MADKNFLTEIIDADLAAGKVSEIHTRFPAGAQRLPAHRQRQGHLYQLVHRQGLRRQVQPPPGRHQPRPGGRGICPTAFWRTCTGWAPTPTAASFTAATTSSSAMSTPKKLIREGKAYVDDLSREEMREYPRQRRRQAQPSLPLAGTAPPEENLDLFRRMARGRVQGGGKDPAGQNRPGQPQHEYAGPPPSTASSMSTTTARGDKWCIYPMYDFAHPHPGRHRGHHPQHVQPGV